MPTSAILLAAAAGGFLAGSAARAVAAGIVARLPARPRPQPGPAWRRPLAELATAIAVAAVVAVRGADGAELVLGLVLVAFLVPICLVDLDHLLIPDRLTVPAAVVAIVLGTALDPGGEATRILAGLIAGATLALPSLVRPQGIGMGDAKLVAVLGLFLGTSVAPAFVAAFLAGSVAGGVIIARKGVAAGRKTAVPFGPFLALGGVVGVLAGDELVHAYLSAF